MGNYIQLLQEEWNSLGDEIDLSEEEMEELRMMTGFEAREIKRLRISFLTYVQNGGIIKKGEFLKIPAISVNPLKGRLLKCFGYEEGVHEITFRDFMTTLAIFNNPGNREMKLRMAFKLQDFDDDGKINKEDLFQYFELIIATTDGSSIDFDSLVERVMAEGSSHPRHKYISYNDFQRIVAPTDFENKLRIPI